MSHSAVWDKTRPLGTDLASSIDNFMRDMKRDVEERMQLEHYWAESLDWDGRHKNLVIIPGTNTIPIKNATNEINGSTVGGLIDMSQTWNTTGVSTGIKTNIIDTAHGAGSALLDLQVNGVSKFKVDMNGEITVGSFSGGGGGGGGTGNVSAGTNWGVGLDNRIVRTDGENKNIQASAVTLADDGSISGINFLSANALAVLRGYELKTTGTVYQAPCDGFAVVIGVGTTGLWAGTMGVNADATNPPATLRGVMYIGADTVSKSGTLTVPIKAFDYWKVNITTESGSPVVVVYWIPMGLNG